MVTEADSNGSGDAETAAVAKRSQRKVFKAADVEESEGEFFQYTSVFIRISTYKSLSSNKKSRTYGTPEL